MWCEVWYILYIILLYYIIHITIIILYIIHILLLYTILSFPYVLPSHLLFLSQPSFPIYLLFSPDLSYSLPNHSIRVGTYITLFIFFQLSRIIRPRTNYRRWMSSGAVLLVSGSRLMFWAGVRLLCFSRCDVFDVRCILYIILYLYTYYILLYYSYYYLMSISPSPHLLFYSPPLPSQSISFLSQSIFYPPLPSPPPIPLSSFFPFSFKVYVSGLTYEYLYSLPDPPKSDPACFIGVDGWGV